MKDVGVAEFKAKLSEYLRFVRKGNEVVVYDRNDPVARVVPYTTSSALVVREAIRKYATLGDIPIPPMETKLERDPVEVLLADRNSEE